MSEVRRGVYILPNLFTSASLFFGFYAIIHAIQTKFIGSDNYKKCALAIIVAAVFDGLDGRVARKTKSASRFGVEYDSLSDLISFGMAPAIIMYLWTLHHFGRVGWLVAFLYMACTALRLARFNVQNDSVEKQYFEGLPSPMAALMIILCVMIWGGKPIGDIHLFVPGDVRVYFLALTFLVAGLMVSSIPYRSFKTLKLTQRHSFYILVLFVVGLVVWATTPWWVFFGIGCLYLLSGPVEKLVHVRRTRPRSFRRSRRSHAPSPQEGSEPSRDDNVRSLRT